MYKYTGEKTFEAMESYLNNEEWLESMGEPFPKQAASVREELWKEI